MRKFLMWIKNNILLFTILVIGTLIGCNSLLGIYNMRLRLTIIYNLSIIIVIGLITGTIQLFRKKGKIARCIIIAMCIGVIIIVVFFWPLILLGLAFSYTPEHVVEKDNKMYIAHVNSWLDTDVDYYDYINFFLMGNVKRIKEYYYNVGKDVLADKTKNWIPAEIDYYDENGKIIKERTKYNNNSTISEDDKELNIDKNEEEQEQVKKEDVLYEKKINDLSYIRVVYLDSILGQRMIINIQKTLDGGKTWENQLQMSDGYLTINNGAEFIFLDENIGFINDKGTAGTLGKNRKLLVTIDGGKKFVNANIIKPNTIVAKNFFIDGIPYIEDNILKVKVYIIEYDKGYQEKVYYDFYSEDEGLNWKIDKE